MFKYPEFILVGMKISSLNDNDKHYISAKSLIELYDLPKEHCKCVELTEDSLYLYNSNNDVNPYQIILYPRVTGDYKEHLFKKMLEWSTIKEI